MPRLFRPKRATKPRLPAGERIYAIGDVHGRLDLLYALLTRISADVAARPAMRTRYVILGDIIDRGPKSRDLMELLAGLDMPNFLVLKGNHEAALLDVRHGDHDAARLWVTFGGLATLASFGVDIAALDPDDSDAIIATVRRVIPDSLAQWLEALPVSLTVGDYFFVHAGVRPGVPIARQSEDDLLWIRDPFLSSTADHGLMIVHGHSIHQAGIDFAANRIGVDTGAYRTGRLSAVGLEGDQVWSLHTGDDAGGERHG
ncbi:metallophosphoesterase family protein [Polymorphobacter fuscus]|uniref:Serine/threonine protein phosphatase n=1 Tax=Sandarakinorhabdus fusca TaxID=1439888 RepID=A0A7C9GV21_9SPHN|nr:metallophosphoesterase family protein [Polymorphobacter fuscus]KAB7647920.1 serine/threonine protein phosphatase [Polymorphobacter fuscus]MQT17238.1 serine/threonine protein phosphatase [Polymorphobacter fuscus]NJC08768.1 serine/threonine protein phosphatase 1 [Polymorphobacter fuscus]